MNSMMVGLKGLRTSCIPACLGVRPPFLMLHDRQRHHIRPVVVASLNLGNDVVYGQVSGYKTLLRNTGRRARRG